MILIVFVFELRVSLVIFRTHSETVGSKKRALISSIRTIQTRDPSVCKLTG